jgi:hypothetical protein
MLSFDIAYQTTIFYDLLAFSLAVSEKLGGHLSESELI